MLKWTYAHVTIGLSSQAFVLYQNARWWNNSTDLASQNLSAPLSSDSFDGQCEQIARLVHAKKCDGSAATLIVSDELIRMWMVEPPQNVESFDDLRASAAARFQAMFGEPLAQWHLEADWRVDGLFLASAMPKSLVVALQALSKKCRFQWKSISPHSVILFNRWRHALAANAWLVAYQSGKLSFLVTNDQKTVQAYRHIPFNPDEMSSEASFIQLLNREALRMNIPSPRQVYFSRILNEFSWLLHATDKGVRFTVLSNFYPSSVAMTPVVDLTLSGA
jgi:hypothetical protein